MHCGPDRFIALLAIWIWLAAGISLLTPWFGSFVRKQGMGIIVGSPLQQGALARRYDNEINGGARWLSSPRRAQYRQLYAFLDEVACRWLR